MTDDPRPGSSTVEMRIAKMIRNEYDRRIALWMGARGYATGHGDTLEDLLVELEGQAKERGRRQRFEDLPDDTSVV